jgi:hypothetical protein
VCGVDDGGEVHSERVGAGRGKITACGRECTDEWKFPSAIYRIVHLPFSAGNVSIQQEYEGLITDGKSATRINNIFQEEVQN